MTGARYGAYALEHRGSRRGLSPADFRGSGSSESGRVPMAVGEPSMPAAVNVGRRDMVAGTGAWHLADMDHLVCANGAGIV